MRIAISGLAGSGKTAVANKLVSVLNSRGLRFELLAPTFKEVVSSLGLSLEEYEKLAEKDHSIDKKFDEKVKEVFYSKENVILASWLAIWIVDADLKVFLHAPREVRARRIMERESLPFEEAIDYIKDRDARNKKRYNEVYGIDIFKPWDVAHLSINTSYFSIDEEARLIASVAEEMGKG